MTYYFNVRMALEGGLILGDITYQVSFIPPSRAA